MKRLLFLMIAMIAFGYQTASAQEVVDENKPLKVKPTVAFHGRVQYDYEFLKQEINPDSTVKFSGSEFRRVYLSGSGKIYKNIKYKAQFEFAGSKIGFRDVYIKFTKLPGIGGNFTIGSFAEATGLDMSTSSKYIPMIERAMMTSTQNFRWNSGIMYDNMGLFGGKLGIQLSYAHNGHHNAKSGESGHKGGFKDYDLSKGGHFVARLTSPVYSNKEKNQLVHLGFNYEYRKRSEDPAKYTLKFRPENHMGHSIKLPINDVVDQQDIGFELAANFGPFSLQGEYEVAGYNKTFKDGAGKEVNESVTVNGFYGLMSFFVTGGHRGFKHGAYSRVKPYKNFCIKDGDWGELELVARYSTMDFSSIIEGNYDNKIANIGFGFNWYLNDHTRIMYNHNITGGNKKDDDLKKGLHANLLRLAIDF